MIELQEASTKVVNIKISLTQVKIGKDAMHSKAEACFVGVRLLFGNVTAFRQTADRGVYCVTKVQLNMGM